MRQWTAVASLLLSIFRFVAAQDDDPSDFHHFLTRRDILAPKWNITTYHPDALAPGFWFVAPYEKLHQVTWPLWNGPLIYDTTGQLIWSGAPLTNYYNAFDFRVSELDGDQVLSFILPNKTNVPEGGIILDNSYNIHRIVDMRPGGDRFSNMHEFRLIDGGKRCLTAAVPPMSPEYLSIPSEGFDGKCKISWHGFRETDTASGEVVFEWSTKDHIDVEETTYYDGNGSDKYTRMCAKPWDIAHVNAVDKFDDGDYLVSARHMDAIYKVSRIDGSIVWRLGGTKNDFVFMDQRAMFTRQHHARFRGFNGTHTLISLFDNGIGGEESISSSFESWGLVIALRTDKSPMTAELVTRYEKPFSTLDDAQEISRGSVSFLPNGNAFVGWPTGSQIAEYTAAGRMLMHAMFPKPEFASYRSFKQSWVGRPTSPPDVLTRILNIAASPTTEVFVSWNGDTETSTWALLRTNAAGNVSEMVASSSRQGFETKLIMPGLASHVVVVALDNLNHEITRSGVLPVKPPAQLGDAAAIDERIWLASHSSAWQPEPSQPSVKEAWPGSRMALVLFVCGILIGLMLLLTFVRMKGSTWWSRESKYEAVESEEIDYHDDKRIIDNGVESVQPVR